MSNLSVVDSPISVLKETRRRGLARQCAADGIAVLVREASRHQPDLPAAEAVARVAARGEVSSVVAGISQRSYLDDLIRDLL